MTELDDDILQEAVELSAPAPAPDEDAPYGYTVDRVTGERRPKLKAGRPSGSSEKIRHEEDRAPEVKKTRGRRKVREDKPEKEIPPFRAGPIAKGMNKLYAKVGKVVRAVDPVVGQAIINATKKEFDDDVTVGEAWEEVAKYNPRVRAFLLMMMSGQGWASLFWAHAPIFLAILMKDGIRNRIPFMGAATALLEPEDDGTPGISEMLGGLNASDIESMMGMFSDGLEQMARNASMPRQPMQEFFEETDG